MKITHVAIKSDLGTFSLPMPNRHHHVIHKFLPFHNRYTVEGFLSEDGTFYDRKAAMKLAEDSGQLKRRAGDQYYQGPYLYSEDLW